MTLSLPIIPRAFIDKSKSPVLCHICFEPSEEMFICGGACRLIYCTWCASQNKLRICPIRCSPHSYLQPIDRQRCVYYCPYQQCNQKLNSLAQFWPHSETCQYATPQAKAELQYRKDYLCKKGHKLYFVTAANFYEIYTRGGHYDTTNNQVCMYCREKFLSKSICLECGVGEKKGVYCINCRPIPCDKKNCPIGHELSINRDFGGSMICDFCGVPAKIYGGQVRSDRECNFDICLNCLEKVPEKHHLTPLQNQIPKELTVKFVMGSEHDSSETEPYFD